MPSYNFECINDECKEKIFTEFRQTSRGCDSAVCPECGSRCVRSYVGQNTYVKMGKIRSYGEGSCTWENVDNVPAAQELNTEVKGEVMESSTFETKPI